MNTAQWYKAQAEVHRRSMERHIASGYRHGAMAAKQAMLTALENEIDELVNRWYEVTGKYMRTNLYTGEEWMEEMPEEIELAGLDIEHEIETKQGIIDRLRGEQ